MQARAAVAVLALLSLFTVPFGEGAKAWVAGGGHQPGGIDTVWAQSKIQDGGSVEEPEAETVNAAYGYKNSPVAMEASYGSI